MAAIAKRAPWWIDHEICDLGRMLTVSQLSRTLATYPFPDHPHPDTLTDEAAIGDVHVGHHRHRRHRRHRRRARSRHRSASRHPRTACGSGSVTTDASASNSKPTPSPA